MPQFTIEENIRWAFQYVSELFLPEDGFWQTGLDLTDQQKKDIIRHINFNKQMTREEHKKYLRAWAKKQKDNKMPQFTGQQGYTGFLEKGRDKNGRYAPRARSPSPPRIRKPSPTRPPKKQKTGQPGEIVVFDKNHRPIMDQQRRPPSSTIQWWNEEDNFGHGGHGPPGYQPPAADFGGIELNPETGLGPDGLVPDEDIHEDVHDNFWGPNTEEPGGSGKHIIFVN